MYSAGFELEELCLELAFSRDFMNVTELGGLCNIGCYKS